MGVLDDYNRLKKKRLGLTDDEEEMKNGSKTVNKSAGRTVNNSSGDSMLDEYNRLKEERIAQEEEEEDIAPFLPSVRVPTKTEEKPWYQSGVFADGYQFGDVSKHILGLVSGTADDVAPYVVGANNDKKNESAITVNGTENQEEDSLYIMNYKPGVDIKTRKSIYDANAKRIAEIDAQLAQTESGKTSFWQSTNPIGWVADKLSDSTKALEEERKKLVEANAQYDKYGNAVDLSYDELIAKRDAAEDNADRLYYLSLANQRKLSDNAELMANTKMDGTDHSVYEELQQIATMENGEEKEKRKAAAIKKMESLGVNVDDYALYSDDENFSWGTFFDWLGNTAMSGLASFNKGLTSTVDLLLGQPLQAMGWENNPISSMAQYYSDSYDNYKFDANLLAEKLGGGKGYEYAGAAIEGTTGALPNAILALMTSGASLGGTGVSTTSSLATKAAYESGNILTKAGLTTSAMAKNPQYWLSFAQTYGTDYEEAKSKGADDFTAAFGATLSSLINAGIEIGIDGGSGFQGLPDKVAKGDKNAIFEWLKSGIEEGGEEGAQKLVNEVITKYLYDHDAEILNPLEYATEMSIGTLSGLALGGGQIAVQSGTNAIKNAKQEHEAKKLTETEQKVFDKVYEDRIAEESENGEVTNKRKKEIREEILNEMEKGYLSTDTIEEVLAGDSYKAYKDNIANEEAIRKEYDELYNMKNGDKSSAQVDREAELKKMLEEIDNGTTRSDLRSKLNDEVFGIIKGSRLANSYIDSVNRKRKYADDATKYTNKYAKTTIENAIKSGVVNNSNRAHEMTETLTKLSSDKNVIYDFVNDKIIESQGRKKKVKATKTFTADGTTTEFDLNTTRMDSSVKPVVKVGNTVVDNYTVDYKTGKIVFDSAPQKGKITVDYGAFGRINGWIETLEDGTKKIMLNMDSNEVWQFTTGHEITHSLEGTKKYSKFRKVLYQYAKDKGDYDSLMESVKDRYEEGTDYDSELTADLVGRYLFQDEDFVKHLSVNHRHVFQWLWDEVKHLSKMVTAGSKEARQLEKVKHAFENAYRAEGKAQTGTQYSITESFTDSNGTRFENAVLLDTNFFDGTSPRNWGAKLRDMINKRSSKDPFIMPIVDENGNTTILQFANPKDRVRKNGGSDHNVLNELSSTSDNISKLAVVHIDEIVSVSEENSPYYTNENNHQWLDKNGWLHRNANVINRMNGNIYNLTIDIAKAADGRTILYATDGKIKKVGNVNVNSLKIKGSRQNSDFDGIIPQQDSNVNKQFSISDSDGNQLTEQQQEYFKDSKVRDENGNLKVMYHGSRDAGFHVFDSKMSDDGTSFFFVDRNDVAASYSGTTETYEAKTIRTAEDMNNFIESIGADGYEVVEQDGKFTLLYDGDRVAESDTAPGIYKEFCWYEGVGEGDANYKVYLNLKNPLVIDAEGRNWNNVSREYSQEVADRYNSLTAEEKEALVQLASWEDIDIFRDGFNKALVDFESGFYQDEHAKNLARAFNKLGGYDANVYDAFSIASDNFSAESIQEFAVKQMNTRDYAQKAKADGYDGVIFKNIHDNGGYSNGSEGASTVAIAFDSNQIKSVANQAPTSDPDIRFSISEDSEHPTRYGNFATPMSELRYDALTQDVAPVQEVVAENATTTTESVTPTDIAPVQVAQPDEYNSLLREKADLERRLMQAATEGSENEAQLAEEYNALTDRINRIEAEESAMQRDRLDSLSDSDVPPEMEAPYYGESETVTPDDPFANRDIKEVGNRKVKAYMYENPEVKPFFQDEARAMLGDLRNSIKGERWYNDKLYAQTNGEYGFSGTKRHTTDDIAYLLDEFGYTYAEIEKGLNAIIEDNGAENNAVSKRIEFMLDERLRKGYTGVFGEPIPANQEYINLLNEKQIMEYSDEARNNFMEHADEYAPLYTEEVIAPIDPTVAESAQPVTQPVTQPVQNDAPTFEAKTERNGNIKGQQTMWDTSDHVAQVMVEEPKAEKKKSGIFGKLKNLVLDKGMVFEDLSLKTGNRELQARWNSIRYAEGKAQRLMEKGNTSVNSLKSIRESVEKTGKVKQFYEYLYHLHNVDRMSIESEEDRIKRESLRERFKGYSDKQIESVAMEWITKDTPKDVAERIRNAREYIDASKTKNKPVFGYDVTAEMSQEAANRLEKDNPEFKQYAKDVYDYMTYLRDLMVENGVISKETAQLWSEMYPHYVPIRRVGDEGLNINVPLDTRKTGVNAPVKGATGGNRDILPLFDTMGQRTIQTFKAIAKNRFGVELKNTLGTTISKDASDVDSILDSVDKHDGLLKKGENGNSPTFTVFENGERVTFEITEEMYDAMKPTSDVMAYTNKVANAVSNFRRGTLTEYNPWFLLKNAVKDVQDVLINSQHPAKTYAAIPKAIKQMATNGHWYTEYLENGGEQNTYFDNQTNTIKEENESLEKVKKFTGLDAISKANNVIERLPRLAEYIASRESGRSVDVSMLDSARVTTNFAAGGDLTKLLNRNGATFLNASVQGFMQQVRNVREAKRAGLKGAMNLAAKFLVAGLPAVLLNNLVWDDDDEYDELSDYVKQNYYIVGKYGDGKFVRIPKGRTVAVIQNAFEQMGDMLTGNEEADLNTFLEMIASTLELAGSNLAPNNPIENNILSPIAQVASNKTWYGEDLVPTRLQNLPEAEQYDESTDAISKWLGETFNISPYKTNYLLDQYSGVIGDTFLPMLTPEAESGDNSFLGNMIAPLKDMFTTDGVLKNQNVSDFYDKKDELTVNANSSKATEKDVLMSKYMNSINSELSELYKQKREIQNSSLSDAEKYEQVRDIQSQIVELTRESLNTYDDIEYHSARDGEYSSIGDRYFKLDDDGEWQKLSDDQVTKYKVTSAAGDAPYASDGENHYHWYEPGEDSDAEPGWRKITEEQLEKQKEVTSGLDITPEEYWGNKDEYDYAYKYPGNYAVSKAVGSYESYRQYSSELYDIKADKDANGKSISGSRKEKVIDYLNDLDIDYGSRMILFKSEYPADDTYNYDIINYLEENNAISADDMRTILTELGFKVHDNGTITWD
ncbi:MAG: hypothetical protein J6B01_06705 [Ruminococcus sp.]|nr:hypothetical protein [Ruminococcus sp.]